ncbi:MAG TPA: alpha/beta fold hydrolase [Methylomirabilota bacterium]
MAAPAPDAVPAWVDRVGYPFRSRLADLPTGRVHYVDEGTGEPVLFVHGTPTWSYEWRHLIRALAPRWRCVAPDLLGFGLSERPTAFAYTPEAHADVLAAFVERLGLERFTLVVHDYGGPIGLPLCLDRPERVRRLVLLNTWGWPLDDDPALRRAGRLAGSALGRFLYRRCNASLRLIMSRAYGDRRKLTPAIHRQYLAPFPGAAGRERVLWALARALLGSSAHYADLWRRRERLRGRPVLIVWGLADPAFPPRHLARWVELFGAEARVVRLPDAGHWPHEEAPDAVAQALVGFLEES